MNKSRICIECHHAIARPTSRQEMHKRCAKQRSSRTRSNENRTTTRGNSVATVTAKGEGDPRQKQKTAWTFSDLMHTAPEVAAKIIDRILAGEATISG